jgi:uncharacterized protein YcfJ
MRFETLKLIGAAFAAAAMLAPCAAHAQYYGNVPVPSYSDRDSRDMYGDEIAFAHNARDRRGYRRDAADRDPPRRAAYRERRVERCDHGSAGTILGAIAGGLLGNAAIGRHGNHAAGALAGAGAGALFGNAADRDCD